ncbi:MAG TPA: SDR family NAD(P)-dependent oxidoreductase [Candidatus Acidoferrales bacterium]|nr:SDR family NAD(P)-dependent oxidoreductase [Candidatus Acidoferrales bacterium]
MLLAGQVTIITGGGRGIGRAIALGFAREGSSVLLAARTQTQVDSVAAELKSEGHKAAAVAADVSQESGCQVIVEAAQKQFGRIDILVNNAGVLGPVKAAEETSPKEWDEVIAVNLRGPFLLSRLVLPEMYRRGSGAIINISSVAAKAAFQWNSPYAASKAGLVGFTRTLAAEAARKGVRVNAICPGPVPETEMSQTLGKALADRLHADPDALFKGFLEQILQGKPQTAADVADAALFLASSQSAAITGQTLNVDGGMSFY